MFKEYPALRVEISGHTSDEGKRDFNMKLSRKRAEAVKLFLVSAGIDEKRIGTVGYGPDKPIADNETKEGKEKNRRIEFRLLGTEEKVQTQPEPEDINPAPDRDGKGKAKAKGKGPARRRRERRRPKAKEGEEVGRGPPPDGDPMPSESPPRTRPPPPTRPPQGDDKPAAPKGEL